MRFVKHLTGALQPLDEPACNLFSAMKVGQSVEFKEADKPKKPRRSTMQNGYYFGVVVQYFVGATDGSYTKDQFHDWLKREVFGEVEMGGRRVAKRRTRDLNTEQMEQYLKRCREVAWERFEMVIPKPNECGWDY